MLHTWILWKCANFTHKYNYKLNKQIIFVHNIRHFTLTGHQEHQIFIYTTHQTRRLNMYTKDCNISRTFIVVFSN